MDQGREEGWKCSPGEQTTDAHGASSKLLPTVLLELILIGLLEFLCILLLSLSGVKSLVKLGSPPCKFGNSRLLTTAGHLLLVDFYVGKLADLTINFTESLILYLCNMTRFFV